MSKLHFSLVILTVCLISQSSGKVGVHIISGVPDHPSPLQARCQSKDDDIGMHTLHNGEGFSWRFRPNIIPTTPYFCHFYWGAKDRSFAVYDARISRLCKQDDYWNCDYYWVATPTGFNVSADNKVTWKTLNYWN